MYCQTCGATVARGLRYCNHCGEEVYVSKGRGAGTAELSPEIIVRAMLFLFIVCLGAVIAMLAVMKGVDPSDAALIKAFAVLTFLLLLSVEGVFTWLLLRSKREIKEAGAGDAVGLKAETTKALDAAPERALPEATPQAVPSITEHTTRTLEPASGKRKSV